MRAVPLRPRLALTLGLSNPTLAHFRQCSRRPDAVWAAPVAPHRL